MIRLMGPGCLHDVSSHPCYMDEKEMFVVSGGQGTNLLEIHAFDVDGCPWDCSFLSLIFRFFSEVLCQCVFLVELVTLPKAAFCCK